jgi:oligopeptide transport system substrate-binding protein
MRSRAFLIPLGAFALLFAAGCGSRQTAAEEGIQTGTLLLGNGAEPADLDPHVITAFTDANVAAALLEGLTALDESTSQPVPAIAERWETSADGLVWTFHLRENARWSNGDPVTAGDFVYSIRRMLTPAMAAEYSYMMHPIRNARAYNEGRVTDPALIGAEAVDPRTLRLTLEDPCPWLLALTAHATWLPVHPPTIERFGAAQSRSTEWTRAGNFVGNGPFLLTEWTPNARIVVDRNPQYWDAANTTINRVVFFPNNDIATDERNFRAGQIHVTYELSPDKLAAYREENPEVLRVDPFLETTYLRFNVTRPPFDNPLLRQALARAIDREAIARSVLRGSRVPATALVPPGTAGYTSRTAVPTDFDEARALLAQAGYPGGQGLAPFEVQIKNDDIHRLVLEAIQEMWKRELGVTLTISSLEQKTWIDNWVAFAYQASSARWIGDYVDPSTFLEMFVTGGGNNLTGWSSAEYDRLIAEAARTLDTAARQELQQQAEAILLRETPITPIFHGTRIYLIDPAVRGWEPALLGNHRYQYLRLEAR